MSIPHFDELTPTQIYESLNLIWSSSEKLDGSYLRAGLDQNGKFYVTRKASDQLFRSPCDWPKECWTRDYRLATLVASFLVEALSAEKLIEPGQYLDLEVLSGRRPNSITYHYSEKFSGQLIVTGHSYLPSYSFFKLFERFECRFQLVVPSSLDGLNIQWIEENHHWKVATNFTPRYLPVLVKLRSSAGLLKVQLKEWFDQSSRIPHFTNLEILEMNLSRKPEKAGNQNWNELRKEISLERKNLDHVFKGMIANFSRDAHGVLVRDFSSGVGPCLQEGVVVSNNGIKFKFVDKEGFRALNLFTHRIKYMLIGGRRPKRSSFLSRTENWPIDKRLARLEQLRLRYLKHRTKLSYIGQLNQNFVSAFYDFDLHYRTLNLFADTRKRILDGR